MITASNTNNFFNLYLQSVLDFAQTVVIKLDQVAETTNYAVMQKTGSTTIDTNDRSTWKYYQNISGAYHFSDDLMHIESLDGNGQILFAKDSLVANPITKGAYSYGSYYYKELIARYPDQEMLILGILYPCDISAAIAAKDGTIMAYPTSLVEDNEVDFIPKLQDWVYDYFHRWVNPLFTNNNNLYVAAYLAQITLNMIPAIMNIRLRACKTNQAHSFHVSQYLRSHGLLDTHILEMDATQRLDLYRNIRYYQRYAGFSTTFKKLSELLLGERGLPLYSYQFHHNSGAINYIDPRTEANIWPIVTFTRDPSNSAAQSQGLTRIDLTDAMALVDTQAKDNEVFHANNSTILEETLQRSTSASLQTKVLESTLDLTKDTYVQAPDTLVFNEWINLASAGVYRYVFEYTPPGETVPIQLTQQAAVALWFYAMTKATEPAIKPSNYTPITSIPQLGVHDVLRYPTPSKETLSNLVDTGYFTSSDIDVMVSLVTQRPALLMSRELFEAHCSRVFVNASSMYRYYSLKEHPYARAMGQMVTEALHYDKLVQLPELTTSTSPYVGMTFVNFLKRINFNPTTYGQKDYFDLAKGVYEAATGVNLNLVTDPKNIQEAMVNLLRMLSSYSIEVVYTPSTESAIPVNHPDVRAYNLKMSESGRADVPVADITPTVLFNHESAMSAIDWQRTYDIDPVRLKDKPEYKIDLDLGRNYVCEVGEVFPAVVPVGVHISSSFDPIALFDALPTNLKQKLLTLGA